MPTLDFSEVTTEPMFMDRFSVTRRPETISSTGRSQTDSELFRPFGIVTMASPDELERLPEEEHTLKGLSIITRFPLRSSSKGYQPDIVQWAGDDYTVRLVEDYTRFGKGWTYCLATVREYNALAPGSRFQFDNLDAGFDRSYFNAV